MEELITSSSDERLRFIMEYSTILTPELVLASLRASLEREEKIDRRMCLHASTRVRMITDSDTGRKFFRKNCLNPKCHEWLGNKVFKLGKEAD